MYVGRHALTKRLCIDHLSRQGVSLCFEFRCIAGPLYSWFRRGGFSRIKACHHFFYSLLLCLDLFFLPLPLSWIRSHLPAATLPGRSLLRPQLGLGVLLPLPPPFANPIYGMPGLGLVSPPAESSSQATDITMNIGGDGTPTKREKPVSFLRVRIGGLERNRKDLLIRFDASVSPCLVQAFLRYGTTS